MKTAEAAVGAGIFVPNTDSWRCSAKWCEFFADCRYVVHKPVNFKVDIGVDLSSQLSQSIAQNAASADFSAGSVPPNNNTTNGEDL